MLIQMVSNQNISVILIQWYFFQHFFNFKIYSFANIFFYLFFLALFCFHTHTHIIAIVIRASYFVLVCLGWTGINIIILTFHHFSTIVQQLTNFAKPLRVCVCVHAFDISILCVCVCVCASMYVPVRRLYTSVLIDHVRCKHT